MDSDGLVSYTVLLTNPDSETNSEICFNNCNLSQHRTGVEIPSQQSPNEDATPPQPMAKKVQRSKNFSIEEDNLLVSAWLNVSIDAVTGSEQKKTSFWKRIGNYFHEEKNFPSERSDTSLTHRWATIHSSVNKFCGYYAQIENFRRCGHNEQDKITEAKLMYQKEERHVFAFDHCWNLLKFHQKWQSELEKYSSKKKAKTSTTSAPASPMNPDSINLEEVDTGVAEAAKPAELARLVRPLGRKASKALEKAKDDRESAPSKVLSELAELKTTRLEQERVRAQQFAILIANEEKQLAIRKMEVEIQLRNEEAKIMAKDTSTMPYAQASYFFALQNEIMAKRQYNGENN